MLIALQEGNEDSGNSTSRGVHLGEGCAQDQALTSSWPWERGEVLQRMGKWRRSVGLTVCANCSSPVSVSNMIYRRRLWKSVQLEALVTWSTGD